MFKDGWRGVGMVLYRNDSPSFSLSFAFSSHSFPFFPSQITHRNNVRRYHTIFLFLRNVYAFNSTLLNSYKCFFGSTYMIDAYADTRLRCVCIRVCVDEEKINKTKEKREIKRNQRNRKKGG